MSLVLVNPMADRRDGVLQNNTPEPNGLFCVYSIIMFFLPQFWMSIFFFFWIELIGRISIFRHGIFGPNVFFLLYLNSSTLK